MNDSNVFLYHPFNRQCAVACLEDVSKFLARGGQVAVSVIQPVYMRSGRFWCNNLLPSVFSCYFNSCINRQ